MRVGRKRKKDERGMMEEGLKRGKERGRDEGRMKWGRRGERVKEGL